jgi:hypothetical protein
MSWFTDLVSPIAGSFVKDVSEAVKPFITTEADRLAFELKLKELEAGVSQKLLEADATASQQVTDRWKADMASDSWLAKNIRPTVLIYLLTAYTIFSIGSAYGMNINNSYVELLAQWGMIVMSAYFVGRTVEKVKQK